MAARQRALAFAAARAELARRWKPILDAYEDAGCDICYEIHPSEDTFDGATFEMFLDAVGGNQVHAIAVAAHHVAGDVIGDDPVAALARELCLGVVDQMFGLGGKTDHQPQAGCRIAGLRRQPRPGNDRLAGSRAQRTSRQISWTISQAR